MAINKATVTFTVKHSSSEEATITCKKNTDLSVQRLKGQYVCGGQWLNQGRCFLGWLASEAVFLFCLHIVVLLSLFVGLWAVQSQGAKTAASHKPCSGAGSHTQHHTNRALVQAAKLSITQTVLWRRQPNSASHKPCSGAGSQTQHHTNRALAQAAKLSITQTVLWRRQPNSASHKPCSGACSQTQHHTNRALAQAAKLSITQSGTILSTASRHALIATL